jgi:hypothetical protein
MTDTLATGIVRAHTKGCGAKIVSTINLKQRYLLFKWCEQNKGNNSIFTDMARKASSDLGYNISKDCMASHWVAVYGNRRERSPKHKIQELAVIMAELTELKRKLAKYVS